MRFRQRWTPKKLLVVIGFIISQCYFLGMYVLLQQPENGESSMKTSIRPLANIHIRQVIVTLDTVRHGPAGLERETQPWLTQGQYTVLGGSPAFRKLVIPTSQWDDRILAQLAHRPTNGNGGNKAGNKADGVGGHPVDFDVEDIKFIYVAGDLQGLKPGDEEFRADGCPVTNCFLTDDRSLEDTAHARIILSQGFMGHKVSKPPTQIWILWILESPLNTPRYNHLHGKINWTATYRPDSTLSTPYGKFIRKESPDADKNPFKVDHNKTKKVAWFVSNCNSANKRLEYALQLSRFIDVDIFGGCGQLSCSRTDPEACYCMLQKDYMFYLSFENSNCKHYITEKYFVNALRNDVVPVVMGARPEDYQHIAPPDSYIHVHAESFQSPQALASYLHQLADNRTMYYRFFEWKRHYSNNSKTRFWCRLCAMLHDSRKSSVWYDDVDSWWRDAESCTRDRWDNPDDKLADKEDVIYDA